MRLNRSLFFALSLAFSVFVSSVLCESSFAQRPNQDRGQRLQQLLQRLDKNKDQQVTRDEVPERMLERFANMDLNDDGAISSEEAKTLIRRMSGANAKKGDAKKRKGKKGPTDKRTENNSDTKKSNAKKKGNAKKGAKGNKKPLDVEANITRMMSSLDKNKDGFINREEAPKRLERNWQRFDTNGNDKLDGEEIKTLRRTMRSQELDKKMKKNNRYDVGSFGGVKPKRPGSGG